MVFAVGLTGLYRTDGPGWGWSLSARCVVVLLVVTLTACTAPTGMIRPVGYVASTADGWVTVWSPDASVQHRMMSRTETMPTGSCPSRTTR